MTDNRHYKVVFELSEEALVICKSDGTVIDCNSKTCELFHKEKSEILNRKFYNALLSDLYATEFIENYNELIDELDGRPAEIEINDGLPDGPYPAGIFLRKIPEESLILINFNDLYGMRKSEGENDRIIEELAISKDIIEQNANEFIQINEKLIESEQKLKELNASKDKFFSIIAHDLRSPFQSLLGYTDLLAKDISNLSEEEIREFAGNLHETAESLFKLLENLLTWSRIQREVIEFIPEPTPLRMLADHNFSLVKLIASNKKIKLLNEIPGGLMADVDVNLINTVFRNLLTNAIKFTPEGGKVGTRGTTKPDGTVVVEVFDTGIGIPAENLDKLFRIDVNFTTQGTENEKGTGLGLVLCKDLVEKNNGKIYVESKPGEGTSFFFELPGVKLSEADENNILEH